jgi:competence protein ComEA
VDGSTTSVVGSSTVENPTVHGRRRLPRSAERDEDATAAGRPSSAPDGVLTTHLRQVVERWSPVGLHNARADPGRHGAVALVAVALLAALIVGGYVWHGRPQAEPVPPPAVVPAAGASRAPGPSGSSGTLVVAVTGKVRHPGVVTVPVGARVIDVLKAAGGPVPGADLALVNLARKVADGELVAVGLPGAAAGTAPPPGTGDTGAAPAGGPAAPVDLNTATLAELDTLPGVGPVLAQRILDWRTAHGQFSSVDQLADVPGIGDSRMAQLRDLVRV